jgi:NAD(P)H dehydrogenase (quinone)
LVSSSDLRNRVIQHGHIINAAKQAGIKHLLYTSFVRKANPEKSPISFIAMEHIETEKMIKESGIPYTLLFNALYADVLPMFMGDEVMEKGIFLPAGTGKAAFTAREDMAEATAILMQESGHENKSFVFSGTENYSFADISNTLSELAGKVVPYHQPSVEQYLETVTALGVPKEFAQFLAAFSQSIGLDEFEVKEADLERILGRKPQTLKNYLQSIYTEWT